MQDDDIKLAPALWSRIFRIVYNSVKGPEEWEHYEDTVESARGQADFHALRQVGVQTGC